MGWILGADTQAVFLGDQIYDHKHYYLADGFHREWSEDASPICLISHPTQERQGADMESNKELR